jgi:AcrR family transcriptional regulator
VSLAPDLPLRRQRALITREKLLAAAREEFQQHGFSGARVDGIAAGAGMNKRLIYVHFGDKEGLFDAVVTRNLEAVVDDVPFDAADLPGYAVRLLDYWSEHPEAARLFWWRNLERSATTEVEEAAYSRMVDEIATRRDGHDPHALPPAHLFAFVLALLQAWAIPSASLDPTEAATEHESRRRSVREAVERLEFRR